MSAALEHLAIAVNILRSLPAGSDSAEVLERLDAQVQILPKEVERHRAALQRPDTPRVDVVAVVEAVFALEREGILGWPLMTSVDAFCAAPSGGQTLHGQLARVRRMTARRAASASRASSLGRGTRPVNDVLALDDGKLLPWAMFITIQGYLERCKPTLERLYRLCAAMREENPRYARMYEKIDRFFKNGGSELADDSFSYAHYLKAHHADPQAYQDALRAMEQEMVAHLGALKQSAGMGHPTTKQGSTPSARPPCAPELPSTQQPKQLAGDANFTRGPAPLQASASPPPPATPPFNSTPNTGALSKAMALLESAPPGVLQRAMRLARECP